MILLLIVASDNGFSHNDFTNYAEWEERIEYPVVDGKVNGMDINNFIHAKKRVFKRQYEETNYGPHTIVRGYLVQEVVYDILGDFKGEVNDANEII